MKLGPDIRRGHHPPFGDPLTFPTRAGSVVLATRGYQLTPYRLLLPHQVYAHAVEATLAESGITEVWALEVVTEWRLIACRDGCGVVNFNSAVEQSGSSAPS